MSRLIEFLITSSTLILLIIIIRACFMGRVKNCVIYTLWLVVLVRLVCPINTFSSSFSIMNGVQMLQDTINETAKKDNKVNYINDNNQNTNMVSSMRNVSTSNEGKVVDREIDYQDIRTDSEENNISQNNNIEEVERNSGEKSVEKNRITPIKVLVTIWGFGSALCILVVIILNIRFRKGLLKNRRIIEKYRGGKCPIYETDKVSTPCLYGVFKPGIYIPTIVLRELSDKDIEQIIQHESKHYTHKDNIWSFVRCLVVSIYWFHPLVWAAAKLSKKDAELFCDESVLANKNSEERIYYGEMLLKVARVSKNIPMLYPITAVHSGKREMKKRMIFIGKNKKYYKMVALLLFIILVAGSLVTFTACNSTGQGERKEIEEITTTGTSASGKIIQYTNAWNNLELTYHGTFSGDLFGDGEASVENSNMDLNCCEIEMEGLPAGVVYNFEVWGNGDVRTLGYLYITNEKIYKFNEFEESIDALVNNKIPEDAYIVCQKEEMKDALDKNEKGWHQYIEIKGDTIEYHSYNNQVESGYFETIIWKKDVGISYYQSGYGAGREGIELEIADDNILIDKYKQKMRKYTDEDIYQVIEEDFDGSGEKEAFVLVNFTEKDEEGNEESVGCELWYIKGETVESLIRNKDCIGGQIQLLVMGDTKHVLFNAENARLGSGTVTKIYGVKEGKTEVLFTQKYLNLYANETGLFGYNGDYFTYDKDVKAWMSYGVLSYHFYWDEQEGKYKEYVAEKISEKEFLLLSGAKTLLENVLNQCYDDYKGRRMITKVEREYLKREDRTIDINLILYHKNGERQKRHLTVGYDENCIEYNDQETLEGNKKLSLIKALKEFEESNK